MESRKGRPHIGGEGEEEEEEEHSADCVARRLTLREREQWVMFGVDLLQSHINNHTYIKSYTIIII